MRAVGGICGGSPARTTLWLTDDADRRARPGRAAGEAGVVGAAGRPPGRLVAAAPAAGPAVGSATNHRVVGGAGRAAGGVRAVPGVPDRAARLAVAVRVAGRLVCGGADQDGVVAAAGRHVRRGGVVVGDHRGDLGLVVERGWRCPRGRAGDRDRRDDRGVAEAGAVGGAGAGGAGAGAAVCGGGLAAARPGLWAGVPGVRGAGAADLGGGGAAGTAGRAGPAAWQCLWVGGSAVWLDPAGGRLEHVAGGLCGPSRADRAGDGDGGAGGGGVAAWRAPCGPASWGGSGLAGGRRG